MLVHDNLQFTQVITTKQPALHHCLFKVCLKAARTNVLHVKNELINYQPSNTGSVGDMSDAYPSSAM